jgi:hypothetical protein
VLLGIASAALLSSVLASLASDDAFVPSVKTVIVKKSEDERKAGRVHGVMGQQYFRMAPETHGVSDQLRFVFTARAEILSIDVSADIGDLRAWLVEFAVGINNADGYDFQRRADMLMHVSWVAEGSTSRHVDETVRLPPGVEVASGDFVGVGAYIGAGEGGSVSVSPEIILLYRWLE